MDGRDTGSDPTPDTDTLKPHRQEPAPVRPPRPRSSVAAGAVALLLAAAASWGCMTVPAVPADKLPSSVLAEPPAAWRDAVEEGRGIARSLVSDERLPGLSLAVAVNGETVWAEGFGWANLETQAPVTPATLFRIGEVSETFTAAAVGLLSERGRLDLDAPVQSYLPGFPEKEWPINTRQLMSHTSGIRHYFGEEEEFSPATCESDAERLKFFADDRLRFRPGTEARYSTWGLVLAGAVVAAVANEPYADFVQREILTPLGMQQTVPGSDALTEPATAHFYFPSFMLDPRRGLQEAPSVALTCILPASGFLSTPSDLVRFGTAMMGDTLLNPATVKVLQTPVPVASKELAGQALGWAERTVAMGADATPTRIVGRGIGEPVYRDFLSAVSLGGHVSGETTLLMTVPERRIAIAVATNVSGASNVSLISTRLADVFVRHLESRSAAAGGTQDPSGLVARTQGN